jgi:hypothetical protein
VEPKLSYLILCDHVTAGPTNLHRINVYGLIGHIRSRAVPPYPVVQSRMVVLLLMAGGRGAGELAVRIVSDDTKRLVGAPMRRSVRFAGESDASFGCTFVLRNCVFPAAGLYWVESLFSGTLLGRQRLLLRP